MAILRGSTHKLVAIAETVIGTTPATPVMLELPITRFSKNSNWSTLQSEQLRSHPFVDKLLDGRFMHEIGVDWELQAASHDMLFQNIFGGTITAKSLAFADAIKGMTMESQAGGGSSLFDQFVGAYLNKLTITASASDTAPVKVSTTGMALSGTLDAAATLATSVTAAGTPDPYIFADATLTTNAVATAVVSGTINLERQVDPLMLWGSRNPREFIPGAVTGSGTLTVPYDGGTQSDLVENFTDAALVFNFAAKSPGTTFRKFTFPKVKLISIAREIATRGGLFQEINWTAFRDPTSGTICTMTTE